MPPLRGLAVFFEKDKQKCHPFGVKRYFLKKINKNVTPSGLSGIF